MRKETSGEIIAVLHSHKPGGGNEEEGGEASEQTRCESSIVKWAVVRGERGERGERGANLERGGG
eukprot:1912286-Rhodomonas_salina.1